MSNSPGRLIVANLMAERTVRASPSGQAIANGNGSILVGDREFLGREQADDPATGVGHHHLFLDARRRIAVRGRAIGLEREYHAFLDLERMRQRNHPTDDGALMQRQSETMTELQTKGRHLVGKAELLRLGPDA